MTQTDPKDIIKQADDLLDDINKATLQFASKTNQIINDVNQGFKTTDKLNNELEKAEFKALEEIDGQIINHLIKTED